MAYTLGVDLGTSFVAAAVARQGRTEMVALGDHTVVAPAVAHVRDAGTILTGDAAERRALGKPDHVARALKRRLADPDPVTLGDMSIPVTTLLGAQLRDTVATVVDHQGGAPDRVVLTRPAHWGPLHQARFADVVEEAGIEAPHLVTEAEAAAAALSGRLADGATVAVYALGGGSAGATVVRRHGADLEILGTPQGTDALGGLDFDDAILSYVDHTTRGALTQLDLDDPQAAVALARLRQDCVLAKEALSLDTETVITAFLPGWHFEVRLTRAAFEDMVRARLAGTVEALSRALQTAGVRAGDVEGVLLVGGSTRIPLVGQMVAREFGRPVLDGVDPTYAVALGAVSVAVPAPALASVPPAPPAAEPAAPGPAPQAPPHPGAPEPGVPAAAETAAPETAARETAAPEAPWPTGVARGGRRPRARRSITITAVAAAVAVLVLALVYLLAPVRAASAPAGPGATTGGPSGAPTAAPPSP